MTIKELREKTGVGLLLCKEGIEYSNGNEEIAIAYIKAKNVSSCYTKINF